ncbi:MAG: hypothetical protein OXI71_17160 [Gemmatimonadota bacterium]|nr:hypothetical protein [Gemmatimonadota bacterium]
MDRIPPAFERRCGLAAGRSVLRCLVLAAVVPGVLEAQDVNREAVDSAHTAYLDVYKVYQDTRATWDDVTDRWESLIDSLEQADRRGDEAARNRLRPAIQGMVGERGEARREFRKAEADWYDAGRTLILRIGAYQLYLSNQLLGADEETQDALLDEYDEMDALRDEVEDQMGPQEPLTLPEMPHLEALPENTPAEVRRKAASLEDHVAVLDRLLDDLDSEIGRLEVDLQSENIMRRWERDPGGRRNLPTGVGGAGAGGTGADTTEVDLDEPTLAQQIEELKQLKEEVTDNRDRFQERAEELRRRLGGTP